VPPGDSQTPLDPMDEQLAERGRALIAAAVAETSAPLGLRERIEADRSRAAAGGSRHRRRRVLGLLLPAGGLVAALVVAVVMVTGGGGTPSVVATAALATRGPVLPAPDEDKSNGAVLKASIEGVPFPYWDDSFQWKAVGARDDKIEDRDARTVYYENAKGVQAAYTILGGDAVDPPSDSRKQTQNGIVLWVTTDSDSGRRIVSWQRGHHTCVLSAPLAISEQKLLALASWKGKGKVPF
jgi:hypothetical protein